MYCRIKNNKIIDYASYKYDNDCIETNIIEVQDLENFPNKLIVVDGKPVLNPNFEVEQKEKELKRVAMLKMTPRDFLLALIDMGVDFNQIEALINSNPRVKIELNYCNHIYRGNPLLDQLAPQFNITKEQLDSLFKERGN